MNPIVNILSKIFGGLDRRIDGMNKKTVNSIKQGAKTFAFLIFLAAIITGAIIGRKNAKIGGVSIIKNTNDVFDFYIKSRRDRPFLNNVIEPDKINDSAVPGLRRLLFPPSAGTGPEAEEKVVEPGTPEKRGRTPGQVDIEGRLSEVDRTDERPPASDVRGLKRREEPVDRTEGQGIITEDRKDRTVQAPGQDAVPAPARKAPEEAAPEAPKKKGLIRRAAPGAMRPMENTRGIVE